MANKAFGTEFFEEISLTKFDEKGWSETIFKPSNELRLHPATHVLHYASTCFEGIKAFRAENGDVGVFRLDDHIQRMINSATGACLPKPNPAQLKDMILDLLKKYRQQVPAFPGAAYIRPALIGTDLSLGRAASPSQTAMLFVIISPVTLINKSDLIIARQTTIADECISKGYDVIIHDYGINYDCFASSYYPKIPGINFCHSYKQLKAHMTFFHKNGYITNQRVKNKIIETLFDGLSDGNVQNRITQYLNKIDYQELR